jgi:hypothetical protein
MAALSPLVLVVVVGGTAQAAPLKVRAITLVESKAPGWPAVPEDAVIDKGRLSAGKKAFLASARGIPAGSPAVKKALSAAIRGLKAGEKAQAAKVLAAIEEWSVKALVEERGAPSCPPSWKDGAAVLKAGKGNGFELVRALTAMLRTAGIPARPSFNGSPVACIFVTPVKDPPFWTVWDPIRPSGSIRLMPLLWLPLRAGEISPVTTEPKGTPCVPVIEGRRYATREEAEKVFAGVKASGDFGGGETPPRAAGLSAWWEVWAIGADYDPVEPSRALTVTVPLPFLKETGSGTREHGVWVSDPARTVVAGRPESETDQELGGLVLTLKIKVGAAAGAPVPPATPVGAAVGPAVPAAKLPAARPEGGPSGNATPVPDAGASGPATKSPADAKPSVPAAKLPAARPEGPPSGNATPVAR